MLCLVAPINNECLFINELIAFTYILKYLELYFDFGIVLANIFSCKHSIMTLYQNLGGKSGVHSYEIGMSCITVQFNDSSRYLYNTTRTSTYNIEQMQRLAIHGRGLNSFISRTVKKGYAVKLR